MDDDGKTGQTGAYTDTAGEPGHTRSHSAHVAGTLDKMPTDPGQAGAFSVRGTQLQQAVVWSEILGKPLALREE